MDNLAIIQQKLSEIEEKEQVTILHAVESGSRAWGFASPDSDYDIRFIYVRREQDYLQLQSIRDVMEWQLDETLDINGWDLKKTLQLLYQSNPTILEWNHSPIVYRTTAYWQNNQKIIDTYFCAKSGVGHYLNMANRNYHAYLLQDMVRLKKYLYVLRPILACKWILERNYPPPVLFSELMDAVLEPKIRPEVERLLQQKMKRKETETEKRNPILFDYITEQLMKLQQTIKEMPVTHQNEWKTLNDLFLQGIAQNSTV